AQEPNVGHVHHGHWTTVVARLLDELPRTLEVLLDEPLGASLAGVRPGTRQDTGSAAVVLRHADGSLQVHLLVHHGDQRLPGLFVVERRVAVVGPPRALRTESIRQDAGQL